MKDRRMVLGLMSGTSCDGVSACLVEIEGSGPGTRVKVESCETYPYEEDLREELLNLPKTSIERLSRLNILLGKTLAFSARLLAEKARIPLKDIALIGSHGHTVYHQPHPQRYGEKSFSTTMQIGEPSVIAQETGITTVADFRMADVAAGGSGAPLVPYVDHLLFNDAKRGRALQNLGGIANVTFLPPRATLEDIIAFDTGPGNMVIDRITEIITHGKSSFDEGGRLAAKGQVNEPLLSRLLEHPYLKKPLPKSTGREDFGVSFTDNLYQEAKKSVSGGLDDLSILATVTAFTARSIQEGYRRFILPFHEVSEVILCGGGVENLTLVRLLEKYLHPIPVRRIEDFGIPSQAKEPLSFAVLANETISGNPSNVPGITGARQRVVLGKVVPGRNWRPVSLQTF